MSTITLPSGTVVDTDIATTWNPATLIEMKFQAESLGDFQTARVKISNRMKKYNKQYKNLLPPKGSLDYDVFFTGPERAEKEMYKRLVLNYKSVVPVAVREWQEETAGLGPDLLARLIGLIGNPRIALPEHMETVRDEDDDAIEGTKLNRVPVPDAYDADGNPLTYERTVRQLWSYCGIGDPGRILTKDMSQEELLARGRRRARAVLYNMANSIVRVGHNKSRVAKPSPYIYLYEETKLRYETKVHTAPCVRCGPVGHPALPGSAWGAKHKDASAKRIVAKAILKDLWQRS